MDWIEAGFGQGEREVIDMDWIEAGFGRGERQE